MPPYISLTGARVMRARGGVIFWHAGGANFRGIFIGNIERCALFCGTQITQIAQIILLTSKDTEHTEYFYVDDNVVIWSKTFCKRAYNTLLANHNLYSALRNKATIL
jgi:ribosomal protein S27AE